MLQEQVPGVGPAHTRDVEIRWIAGGLHPGNFSARGFDGADADRGIGRSRERVRVTKRLRIRQVARIRNCSDDFAARITKIVDQRVGTHGRSVELPESDALAVRTPLETVTNVEFFFVDPVGSAVDDSVRAVAGQLRDFPGGQVFRVDVVAADVSDLGTVRSELREHEAGGGSIAAKLAQRARSEIEEPIIAARVLTPDGLGIREKQKLPPVGRKGIALDREWTFFASGNEASSRYENVAGAGSGLIADDVGAAGRGSGLEGEVGIAAAEPFSAAKRLGPEFGIEHGAGKEFGGGFALVGKSAGGCRDRRGSENDQSEPFKHAHS